MNDSIKVGDNAVDLILALPKFNKSLTDLTFTIYSPSLGLEDRLAHSSDRSLQKIAQNAKTLRLLANNDLPYWESILAASWTTRKLDLIIKESLKHDSKTEIDKRFEIRTDNSFEDHISKRVASLSSRSVLALCSICKLKSGSIGHIPMMDFRCSPSKKNLQRIIVALNNIQQAKGVILETGKSYHFYGLNIISDEDWRQFLAKCLLLAPLVDTRYIAHRLQIGACVLRLTACEQKPFSPRVVKVLA